LLLDLRPAGTEGFRRGALHREELAALLVDDVHERGGATVFSFIKKSLFVFKHV